MFQVAHNTAVVSSTALKRDYKKVCALLKNNQMVIVTNRNAEASVDGILVPYSPEVINMIEDFLEDVEMHLNKEAIEKRAKKSLESDGGKRYSLQSIIDEEKMDI